MKKCYVFINRYLGDKQAGIQAAHAVVRMMTKSNTDVLTWSNCHETLVLLNGGDHCALKEMVSKFGNLGNGMHLFDEPGLNNAITAVAMVPTLAMEETIDRYKNAIKNGFITAPNGEFETLCDMIAKARSFRG